MATEKEAPERIYLQWSGGEHYEDNTWCPDQINDDDVEYYKKSAIGALLEPVLAHYRELLEQINDTERTGQYLAQLDIEVIDAQAAELEQAFPRKKRYTLKAETGVFRRRHG